MTRLYGWLLIVGLGLYGLPALAQDAPAVQRTLQALGRTPANLRRAQLLDTLCVELQEYDPIRAVRYGEEGLKLAQRLSDTATHVSLLLSLGGAYAALSDDAEAMTLYHQALQLARRRNDPDQLVHCYNLLGSQAYYRSDTLAAWQDFHRALALLPRPGVTPHRKISLLGNVSVLCFDQGRDALGLYYTRQALALSHQHQDSLGQCQSLINLASHYTTIGKPAQASAALLQAVELAQQLHKPRYAACAWVELGYLALEQKQYAAARSIGQRALQLSRQSSDKERLLGAFGLLIDAAAESGQYQQAYQLQLRHQALHDSLNNKARLQLLTALRMRYETQEQEQRIRQLGQQAEVETLRNRGLWGVVAALVLGLGGISVLYWHLRRSRSALATQHNALTLTTSELREATAAKDRLYSIVAHDLRGPVASFATLTELIESYLRQDDQQSLRELPGLVRTSTRSLSELLDNLLAWASSQTGALRYNPEPLSVADLFAETKTLYGPTAATLHVQLSIDCDEQLTVRADRNMTRTILRNLLGNAFKFTPSGGRVLLHCSAAGDEVLFSVADTGYGIPSAQLAALRHPTASSVDDPAWRPDSTGLGLLLCREFVARQGGRMDIDSTKGTGTMVRVWLPRA